MSKNLFRNTPETQGTVQRSQRIVALWREHHFQERKRTGLVVLMQMSVPENLGPEYTTLNNKILSVRSPE